jgi:cytidyltransferase-like protein
MNFNHVVCGGTFDHLHAGHKKLLEACFRQGKKVTIGITSGAFVRHKQYHESIQPYAVRYKNVLRFANLHKKLVQIIRLTDIFGSTLTDSSIDAIFVTNETLKGAHVINEERKKIDMKPLSITIIPFIFDELGNKISSESIRQGLINREGLSYYTYLISRDIFILPNSLRRELRNPLGRVIFSFKSKNVVFARKIEQYKQKSKNQSSIYVVSVGDVVTANLKNGGITPSISIIDGLTQRKALNKDFIDLILEKDRYNTLNKKGTIQKVAVEALYDLFLSGHKRAIKQLYVQGEEDLLTLVAVLFAPLQSHVFYGQQGVGAVDVCVTEKMKEKVYNLIKQFN